MGPTGELFEPLGALTHSSAVVAFQEQASALANGGVDVLSIETKSLSEEVVAAVEPGGYDRSTWNSTGRRRRICH